VDLSIGQFELVYNLLSLTIAAMFAAGLFFMGARRNVAPKYRIALLVSSIVVFIAGYHYWRIFESWGSAYALVDGAYTATAAGFNDAYRYADWIITVSLLLVELVAVLALPRAIAGGLLRNLVIASFAMIALGYPGEISDAAGTRWLWWVLSMIPFVYILATLYTALSKAVADQGPDVSRLLNRARTLLLVSWMSCPVAYLLQSFGVTGGNAEIGVQVGYTIADIVAKAGFGIVIYQIARAKSEADGWTPETAGVPAAA